MSTDTLNLPADTVATCPHAIAAGSGRPV
jgi:hypothetical protein